MRHDKPPSAAAPPGSVPLTEAAVRLGVSLRTVYNRIASGKLQTIRVKGSQRVLVASLPPASGPKPRW